MDGVARVGSLEVQKGLEIISRLSKYTKSHETQSQKKTTYERTDLNGYKSVVKLLLSYKVFFAIASEEFMLRNTIIRVYQLWTWNLDNVQTKYNTVNK